MDNETSSNKSGGRRIALGLSDHLRRFATRRNAEVWWEFAAGHTGQWKYYLLEIVNNPGSIVCFNLHGVDVWRGLARATTPIHYATDWELLQIREHEIWWPRIEWWDEDVRTSNPFEQEQES